MALEIGILSDTHRSVNSDHFQTLVDAAFSSCDAIIHAGDLTDHGILEAFGKRPVYAVHGNMCSMFTQQILPESRIVTINRYRIAICHGAGLRSPIEDRLIERFDEADCVVYGHTHQPVIHYLGPTLFINPGSFRSTGPYGQHGSYGILLVEDDRLTARLCTLQEYL